MSDARSGSYVLFTGKGPFPAFCGRRSFFNYCRRITASISLITFLFTSILQDFAWADRTPSELASVGPDRAVGPGAFKDKNRDCPKSVYSALNGTVPISKELTVGSFTLPQGLGTVKDSWKPDLSTPRRGQTLDKGLARGEYESLPSVVIHIQDAHANYACQLKIAEIIGYLNKEYGISMINLEGGAEDYDLSLFTEIPNVEARGKVTDYFVKAGILNGAEHFASNNPADVSLWGIEDTPVYLKNLDVYKRSLRNKERIERYLDGLSLALDSLKERIYSGELLDFDKRCHAFKDGKLDMKDYINYLAAKAKEKTVEMKGYANIEVLAQALESERSIDFCEANAQRDELIDKLQKKLSRNMLKELVMKTMEFKVEKITQEEFYRYLLARAGYANIRMDDLAELKKFADYAASYESIDKLKITDEIEALEGAIRQALYENEKQKELAVLSRNLSIIRDIFSISLTKKEYDRYKEEPEKFSIKNYAAFMERENPAYKTGAGLDRNIVELDSLREEIAEFYEYSMKRDEAFLRNLVIARTASQRRSRTKQSNAAIVITGGFHTENLCELFKKNNIAYISIIPNFRNDEGYECPYFRLLGGGSSTGALAAFVGNASNMALYSHFCAKSGAVHGKNDAAGLEVWRDLVLAFFEGRADSITIPNGTYMILPQGAELPAGAELVDGVEFGGRPVCFVGKTANVKKAFSAERALTEAEKIIGGYLNRETEDWYKYFIDMGEEEVDPFFFKIAELEGGMAIMGGSDLVQLVMGQQRIIASDMAEVNLVSPKGRTGPDQWKTYEKVLIPAYGTRMKKTISIDVNPETSFAVETYVRNAGTDNLIKGHSSLNVPIKHTAIAVAVSGISSDGREVKKVRLYFRTKADHENYVAKRRTMTLPVTLSTQEEGLSRGAIFNTLQYCTICYARGKKNRWRFDEPSLQAIRRMADMLTDEERIAIWKNAEQRLQFSYSAEKEALADVLNELNIIRGSSSSALSETHPYKSPIEPSMPLPDLTPAGEAVLAASFEWAEDMIQSYIVGSGLDWYRESIDLDYDSIDPFFWTVAELEGGTIVISGSDMVQLMLGKAKSIARVKTLEDTIEGRTEVNMLRPIGFDVGCAWNRMLAAIPPWPGRNKRMNVLISTNNETIYNIRTFVLNSSGKSLVDGHPRLNVPLKHTAMPVIVSSPDGQGGFVRQARLYFRTPEDRDNYMKKVLTLPATSPDWETSDPAVKRNHILYTLHYCAVIYARSRSEGWRFNESSLNKIRQLAGTLTQEERTNLEREIRRQLSLTESESLDTLPIVLEELGLSIRTAEITAPFMAAVPVIMGASGAAFWWIAAGVAVGIVIGAAAYYILAMRSNQVKKVESPQSNLVRPIERPAPGEGAVRLPDDAGGVVEIADIEPDAVAAGSKEAAESEFERNLRNMINEKGMSGLIELIISDELPNSGRVAADSADRIRDVLSQAGKDEFEEGLDRQKETLFLTVKETGSLRYLKLTGFLIPMLFSKGAHTRPLSKDEIDIIMSGAEGGYGLYMSWPTYRSLVNSVIDLLEFHPSAIPSPEAVDRLVETVSRFYGLGEYASQVHPQVEEFIEKDELKEIKNRIRRIRARLGKPLLQDKAFMVTGTPVSVGGQGSSFDVSEGMGVVVEAGSHHYLVWLDSMLVNIRMCRVNDKGVIEFEERRPYEMLPLEEGFVVGRDPRISGYHAPTDDTTLSRQHFSVFLGRSDRGTNRVVVKNLSAKNPTMVSQAVYREIDDVEGGGISDEQLAAELKRQLNAVIAGPIKVGGDGFRETIGADEGILISAGTYFYLVWWERQNGKIRFKILRWAESKGYLRVAGSKAHNFSEDGFMLVGGAADEDIAQGQSMDFGRDYTVMDELFSPRHFSVNGELQRDVWSSEEKHNVTVKHMGSEHGTTVFKVASLGQVLDRGVMMNVPGIETVPERFDNGRAVELGTGRGQWQYVVDATPEAAVSPIPTGIIRQNGTNVMARRVADEAAARRLRLGPEKIGAFVIDMGGISDEQMKWLNGEETGVIRFGGEEIFVTAGAVEDIQSFDRAQSQRFSRDLTQFCSVTTRESAGSSRELVVTMRNPMVPSAYTELILDSPTHMFKGGRRVLTNGEELPIDKSEVIIEDAPVKDGKKITISSKQFDVTTVVVFQEEVAAAQVDKKELERQQVEAANAAAGDLARDQSIIDIIIIPTPDSVEMVSKVARVHSNIARFIREECGPRMDVSVTGYPYNAAHTKEDFEKNMREALAKARGELADPRNAWRVPRAIIFAPDKIYERDSAGNPVTGYDMVNAVLENDFKDITKMVTLVKERVPDDGLVHAGKHADLGKELLDYRRLEERADQAEHLRQEAKARTVNIVNHIRTLVAAGSLDFNKPPEVILDEVLNKGACLQMITPVSWKDWAKTQEQYLLLRTSA